MEKQQILRESFTKAKKNGWNSNGYEYIVLSFDPTALPPSVIYTKDFAKAFWGTDFIHTRMDWAGVYEVKDLATDTYVNWESYRFHLMKMVLSEDPILYLKQFLQDNPPSGREGGEHNE